MNPKPYNLIFRSLFFVILIFNLSLLAEEKESDFYEITSIPIPEGIVLEGSGLTWLDSNTIAVCGRRGQIYTIQNALGETSNLKFNLYADGLHEPVGLHAAGGWLYATQRGELTRIKDMDGDGRADRFETVNDQWGITGDYHEYALGSSPDKDGNTWIVLCLTGSFSSQAEYRGWCVRITPDGELIPTSSGIRSPGGIGFNHLGDVFYSDNQGPWNGSSSLKHLMPGSFQGHPGGNVWYDLPDAKAAMGPRPTLPVSNSRIHIEREKIPEYIPPAIIFPHGVLGNSTSGFCFDAKGGFGPFKNQLFVLDQTYSVVNRVVLEKVNGVYQGVAFPFLKGFGSGNLAASMHDSGVMYVAGTDRGWGARGGKSFALDRVRWTGEIPFEIYEMRVTSEGFRLVFTHPVDRQSATQLQSYQMSAYTYIYRSDYGSPVVDSSNPIIKSASLSQDGMTVDLIVDGIVKGHIHELSCKGVRNKSGDELLHDTGYYTLNEIPEN